MFAVAERYSSCIVIVGDVYTGWFDAVGALVKPVGKVPNLMRQIFVSLVDIRPRHPVQWSFALASSAVATDLDVG